LIKGDRRLVAGSHLQPQAIATGLFGLLFRLMQQGPSQTAPPFRRLHIEPKQLGPSLAGFRVDRPAQPQTRNPRLTVRLTVTGLSRGRFHPPQLPIGRPEPIDQQGDRRWVWTQGH